MIIFLRNIPIGTHLDELSEYVLPELKGNIFIKSGNIIKSKILIIVDRNTKKQECHGLVYVDSDISGLRAIILLKRKPFKNRKILVREYIERASNNDRRISNCAFSTEMINKRKADRRSGNKIEVIEEEIKSFNSEHSKDDNFFVLQNTNRYFQRV